MSAQLFYLPGRIAFNSNGLASPGATATFYLTSTTTKKPTYVSSALTTQNTNPVVADGVGRFPPIYLSSAVTYRVIIKDKDGATLADIDPYVPGTAADAGQLQPYVDQAADSAADAAASEESAAASAASIAGAAVSANAAEASIIAALAAGGSVSLAQLEASGLPINVEWFGAVADWNGTTGTDNTTAMTALSAYQSNTEARNPSTFYKGGHETLFSRAGYYFGSTIPIKVTARIRGMGVGLAGGESTLLSFANNIGGVTVERYDTLNDIVVSTTGGDGTLFDGLLLQGGFTADSTYKAGFRLRGRATVQNSIIRRFPGAGVLIAADTSVSATDPGHGNANNSVVENVRVQGNLDGVAISGGDANVIRVQSVDASNNRRWGFSDSSFLSTVLSSCHADANGYYDSTTNTTSFVSYLGRRYSVRAGQDANAGTTTPGSDNQAVWLDEGGGGPLVGVIPTWELNGGTGLVQYRAGGSYYINPTGGASSVLLGCYYETGQPRPQLVNAIAIGGFMGKGMIEGGPHIYANPSFGLVQQRPYSQLWTFLNGKSVTNRFGGNLAEGTDAVDVLSWGSSDATPFNPGLEASLQQSMATGDMVWNSYGFRQPFRFTGYSTSRTYGGKSQSACRYVTEIDQLALGNGQGAGDDSIFVNFGSAAPTTGRHRVGEVVFNDGTITSSAAVFAWRCSVSGTPGTWVEDYTNSRSSSTTGVGYVTGAGGTVTQATSKSTAVALNKVSGQITMQAAALAAGAKVSFVITNSTVAATDVVIPSIASGGTANAYRAAVTAVAAGSFTITVENITAGSLSEAPVINFAVLKAVAA